MRIGIAHHYGWAIAVVASDEIEVVDRRRIELIEPGLPPAPIHHEGSSHQLHRTGRPLTDKALTKLVARVRESVARTTAAALDELELAAAEPILSISIRAWPSDLPNDIAVLRHAPFESRADSFMYCQVLAKVASERMWAVHTFDAKTVEQSATNLLGERASDILHGPRTRLGPPWAKDHRMALAATIMANQV